MATLQPNTIYTVNGVKVCEKIIPDGTRWKNSAKAVIAGFAPNSLYKKQQKIAKNSGKPLSITIHNTEDLDNVHDDAEQYTRATYNENMGSARIHFYVDDVGAWQNLKAGTGMCENDPEGNAEVSWHAGDGSVTDGGNMTSLSIEIIMGDTPAKDAKARDNGARLAAWLLWKHGLGISELFTHTFWVNKSAGKHFDDIDEQCASPIYGKKWCPTYIFGSTNKNTALANWKAFKSLVKRYLDNCRTADDENTLGGISPYHVRIIADKVYIRSAPGTNNAVTGSIVGGGVFTIIEEGIGYGSQLWGKLKSGIGWIPLDQTKRYI